VELILEDVAGKLVALSQPLLQSSLLRASQCRPLHLPLGEQIDCPVGYPGEDAARFGGGGEGEEFGVDGEAFRVRGTEGGKSFYELAHA
jgi:hypothetical protein